ncbi:TRAP transporter small permease [Halomonas piscis]|uniref:TRAP transporter small permease protein n=2 Tax=Halomonas piscis TaxID=3031727 RepID=A0ABY9YW18_9GAMM|nr:TRAP transporter small permease [Halomonas piscis]WNK18967.1 TRAP transporter small permease [Halomonas piscis]
MLAVNLVAILYGVFTRYVAGGAPIWTDELGRYLIIGTVMLATGAVWIEGSHMRVALIERLLPHRLARLLSWYQWLLTLFLALAGAWLGYRYALSVAMFTSQGLGISRTIPVMSLPVGFALLALLAACHGPRPLPTPHEEPHASSPSDPESAP